MSHQWDIVLPYEKPPLTANQRMHWRAKAKITAQVRDRAAWSAVEQHVRRLDRCKVELEWHVADRRRRDADNLVPTLKALCDGLVDARVVRDDTPDLMVKAMPTIVRMRPGHKPQDQFMLLRITALELEAVC